MNTITQHPQLLPFEARRLSIDHPKTMLLSVHTFTNEEDGQTYTYSQLLASVGQQAWLYGVDQRDGQAVVSYGREVRYVQAAHENGFEDGTLVSLPSQEEQPFYLECARLIGEHLVYTIGRIAFYDRETFWKSVAEEFPR